MAKETQQQELVIFKGAKGQVKLKGDFRNETIWATQADIASIFDVTPQNITLHLKNIYKEKELLENSTCKESLQVQKEGNRTISRKVKQYDLDAIIAVGYRISSDCHCAQSRYCFTQDSVAERRLGDRKFRSRKKP